MYSSLRNNVMSKKLLTVLIGTSIFTLKKKNFFEFNNYTREFYELTKQNLLKTEDQEKIEVEKLTRTKLFNLNIGNIINMIYFPIQYSLFFFYETLSKKYAFCEAPTKKKPFLGCSIRYVEELDGMRIINVKSDSPAEKAGLKVNDVILEIEGRKIQSINDYNGAVGSEAGIKAFKILRINELGERKIEVFNIDLVYEL